MTLHKSLIGISVLAASLGTGAASAENPMWYAGASLGQSSLDEDIADDFNAELQSALGVTSGSTIDDQDTAWKIFGGYRLTENFALEAAYVDFGMFPIDTAITAPAAATVRTELGFTAWTIDAVGIFPLVDRLDVFGKAGVAMWDVEADIVASGVGGIAAVSADDDGNDFHYGVGANFGMTDTAAIRLEWERVNDNADLDMWSLGAQVGF